MVKTNPAKLSGVAKDERLLLLLKDEVIVFARKPGSSVRR